MKTVKDIIESIQNTNKLMINELSEIYNKREENKQYKIKDLNLKKIEKTNELNKLIKNLKYMKYCYNYSTSFNERDKKIKEFYESIDILKLQVDIIDLKLKIINTNNKRGNKDE